MKAQLVESLPLGREVLFFQLVSPWISSRLSGSMFYELDTPYGDIRVQQLLTGVSTVYLVREGWKGPVRAYQVEH